MAVSRYLKDDKFIGIQSALCVAIGMLSSALISYFIILKNQDLFGFFITISFLMIFLRKNLIFNKLNLLLVLFITIINLFLYKILENFDGIKIVEISPFVILEMYAYYVISGKLCE